MFLLLKARASKKVWEEKDIDRMTKMNNKAMEEEIKKLQKHMGGLVRTILDLNFKVDALESKNENNELENIIEKQAIID